MCQLERTKARMDDGENKTKQSRMKENRNEQSTNQNYLLFCVPYIFVELRMMLLVPVPVDSAVCVHVI